LRRDYRWRALRGFSDGVLLARKGYRVLLTDRANFPSDTMSSHVVQPLAAAAVSRWGLLDRLVATSCPAIETYAYDFGPFTLQGAPGTKDAPVAYCARRIILNKILVDAASDSGPENRALPELALLC
jgi:2-polyprenyl-6-methoxyphenol hydroxylase-like FAD-dependent oxidoreductase